MELLSPLKALQYSHGMNFQPPCIFIENFERHIEQLKVPSLG